MRERMDDDDERLLERIQQGDAESFGVLYDRTWRWLLSCVVTPRVGSAAAEDVLAETYRTALERIGSFEWQGTDLLHWLAAIARRKCLERLRKDGRSAAGTTSLDELDSLPDPAPSAEAEMIRVETLRQLSGRVGVVLGALNPRYAGVLRMRLLEGAARADCAASLGVTPATFDVVLHRATKAFRKAWDGL
jgi:RNA polymerase sigma-70 factor (ECF subfamily)